MGNLKHLEPKKVVIIGASTGGPGQIEKIINSLPVMQETTLVIAQHMAEGFVSSFAKRLQGSSLNPISVVHNNQAFESANIYICEGRTLLNKENYKLIFTKEDSSTNSFNPDINCIFNSFSTLCKKTEILCLILTGIGDDGVQACKNLSSSGARCITESKESAIVDGMPNRARLLVPNIEVYDIDTIVKIVSEFCK